MSSTFFYRVEEYVTTFGKDEAQSKPFCSNKDFNGPDLLRCKHEAEKYYYERVKGLAGNSYYLPIAGPSEFVLGMHAAASVTLYFVEDDGVEQYLYPLLGEDVESICEGQEVELTVLKKLGYSN